MDTALSDIHSFDHYIDLVSTSQAIWGTPVKLFVRERIADTVLKAGRQTTANGKTVLFVHGATFPSVPDFDLPYQDYSWMAYLAAVGFDVYAVDLAGYGKSSRIHMDDPRNVRAEHKPLIGQHEGPAAFPYPTVSTLAEWNEVDAAVEFVRRQTGAARVNLIGWSRGGLRVGGYAALHPEKVARVVMLAPLYGRNSPDAPPSDFKFGAPTAVATRGTTMGRWDKGIGFEDQYDPAIRDVIWESNMAFDAVGATWGPGVIRHPAYYVAGWNAKLARHFKAPVLMIVGDFDVEVPPETVRNLYDDISSDSKLLLHVSGSHYFVYERQYKLLHAASKDWLLSGKYNGATRGIMRVDRAGNISSVSQ